MSQELKTQIESSNIVPPPPGKMTYEEFLAWADEDTWAEWVDGEVILMSPVSVVHQNIAVFITVLLRHFVEANDLGMVLNAPFQMKLKERPSGREPDVIFVSRARLDWFRNVFLDGAADLAIEIISPDSRRRDRVDKYHEYQQAGVREYWLIDPLSRQADFYSLNDDGVYEPLNIESDGVFNSKVLEGLWLNVNWLWQDPLPPVMSVLKEWGLVK